MDWGCRVWWVAVCALGAVSAGCAVGPNYRALRVDLPDTWHQEAIRDLPTADASLATWWTVFEDPTLVSLIERAGANNLDLRQATARIAEAQARRGVAIGEWFPAVDGSVLYERSDRSEAVDGAFDIGPTDVYSTGLSTSWEVDLFGRIRRSVEAAEAELTASLEDYRDVLVVLYAEVATSYLDARALQARLHYAEENLEGQQETLDLVRVRNRVGLVGDLDLSQAELNAARTASFIPELEEGYVAAVNRLAVLLGTYPWEVHTLLDEPAPVPIPEAQVAASLPADLVRQRPDLRRAERDLAAETARIGVAAADLYPRLTLAGTLSLDASSTADWFTSGAKTWGLGPQLRWNVFDGGRIRSNVRVQEARTREAATRYEQTILEAVEEVENAMTSFAQERERRAALARSAAAAGRTAELVRVLYRTGLIDFLNVLDSERSLFEEQDRLADSEGRVAKNLVRVYRALGGGWVPEDEAGGAEPDPEREDS